MGPLAGIKVVEVAGLAAAPFGCMILADLGADVLRVDRVDRTGNSASGVSHGAWTDPLSRGRRSIALDLKTAEGLEILLQLAGHADVLVEAFRPGVAERLGFGPDVCLEANPRLVYARMTGWGQDGPLAPTAGHDIDYIAISGALSIVGRAGERPLPPVNLAGDFGGGGMLLAIGILAALLERQGSGRGQVIDAAMVDGSALLTAMFHGLRAGGTWQDERGTNLIDGGAPFYDTYQTADGGYLAVGALEPAFYSELVAGLGLADAGLPDRNDRANWPALRERLTTVIAQRTTAEWAEVFAGSDACVAPVLSLSEAPDHPHNKARGTFTEVAGLTQPAPAPRFSRTPADPPQPPPAPGADTDAVLTSLGYDQPRIADLRSRRVTA
ncbi:MAG TPA: CaiB/BaiF CoA-transferase family protein [Streptosporangiaceae bacterium]|nr:CaiB/BaiF CoA-transferase family protein [Streptosporangiaceae bacterium]